MKDFFDNWNAISARLKFNIIFPVAALIFFVATIAMGAMLLANRPEPGALGDYVAAGALFDIADIQTQTQEEPEPEPRIFLAIGDSVTSGFGSLPEERYTAILYERLKAQGMAGKYINKGITGVTTTGLLDLFHGLDEYYLSLIQNAEVVALNIGGNNILAPFLEHLPNADAVMDIITESWDFIFESLDTVLDFVDVALEGWEVVDGWRLWQVWRIPALNRVRQDVSATLDDVMRVVDRAMELELVNLLPLLQGEFPPELELALQRGVYIFEAEFNEIISWLEAHAADAVIVVNTVYNPIPSEFLGTSLEISHRADTLVRDLNAIIIGGAAYRYLIADIYGAFSGEADNMMNMFLDTSAMVLSLDLIHPNSAGHQLIADLNYYELRGRGLLGSSN